MTNKHTPGPWKTVDYFCRAEVIKNQAGQDMVLRLDDATLADMRLMAAAPELLEALEYAVETLSAEGFDVSMHRAVIAKATGGEA